MHGQSGVVHGRRQHQVSVAQALAFVQQHLALREIDALAPYIAALGGRFLNGDGVARARGVFLDHHGVATRRHHPASEDARGLAGFDRAVEGMAGGDLADDFQRCRHG